MNNYLDNTKNILALNTTSINKIVEDLVVVAKQIFPNDTDKQLRYCSVKGMMAVATKMAHRLRTARDKDNRLAFPNIFDENAPANNTGSAQLRCAKELYAFQGELLTFVNDYVEQMTKTSDDG